jgi:hypothetical protein
MDFITLDKTIDGIAGRIKFPEEYSKYSELLGSEDVIGNPRTPAAMVVWKAYHFWAGRYICVVPLNQGKAESIKCHGDFI